MSAMESSNSLRIVIPGGTGQVGSVLARHFHEQGHSVCVLARHLLPAPWRIVLWNGRDAGDWIGEVDGADLVINLAGRSVNCRYTARNRKEILDSRVLSTQAIGRAIASAQTPPRLWLNASTATIYRHALDRPMDEATGEIGGSEPGAPATWRFSIDVAKQWEEAFFRAETPRTRRIALRSSMIMSPDPGGIFATLLNLVRLRLGGSASGGRQFISWIHHVDFIRAVEFLIARENIDGYVNVCSPNPVTNREFMFQLRQSARVAIGLPATSWMLEIGALLMGTETELILKSRRVVPGRLLGAGFEFNFPFWPEAARDLVARWRNSKKAAS